MDHGDGARQLLDLVEQHYALLYRYAYRLAGSAADAEDLTQQTYLVAQTKLPQLRSVENSKSWLCKILRNIYLKSLRTPQAQTGGSLDELSGPAADDQDVAEFPIDSDQLQALLNELPEEFRVTVILFYFEEFSYKEIAYQLEVPIGTVMSRLSRAKKYLRQRLQTESPGPLPAAATRI